MNPAAAAGGTRFGGFRFGLRRFAELVGRIVNSITQHGVQHPPLRLAGTVTRADGSKLRLGGDEAEPNRILLDVTTTTRMPGGYGELTFSLAATNVDISELDEITIYGPGIESAFEGRVSLVSRDTESGRIQITAVGNAILLSDDASAREIYRDIDQSHWNGPSVQRQINLMGSSIDLDAPVIDRDVTTGYESVKTGFTGPWARARRAEAWYDSKGIPIGNITATWKHNGAYAGIAADANWQLFVLSSDDDVNTNSTTTADQLTATSGTTSHNAGAAHKFAHLRFTVLAAGGANGTEYAFYWVPAVIGRHGLTAAANGGYAAQDIIADMLERWCPGLRFTTGANGSIEDDDSYGVEHFLLGFDQQQTVEDGLLALNQFFLNDWGVYDDKKFFWRVPSQASGRIWNARLDEGARMRLEGEAAENLINGVVVYYTNANGLQRSVGPPGSGCEDEDAALYDTSDDNPVTAHGINRRWIPITVSGKTSLEGAVQVGARKLAAALVAGRQGSIQVAGSCVTSDGVRLPAWAIKAGDWICVADDDVTLRKIIQTQYDHNTGVVTCDVDVTPNRIDALLARMDQAALNI